MAWTQADLDALDGAIKTGVRLVKYGDREVEYRTLDEMLRIRSVISTAVSGSRVMTTLAEFSKD